MSSQRPLVVLILVLAACGGASPRGTFSSGTWHRGDEAFHVAPPAAPWRMVHAPAGDIAFYHPQHDAVIAANATCHGHRDPPLNILVNDLLIGTTDREVLLDESPILDGREAKHEVVALRLDGVRLVYDVYVLKKDGCIYDLTLVVPPRTYDAVADQFVGFVASFHGTGGLR